MLRQTAANEHASVAIGDSTVSPWGHTTPLLNGFCKLGRDWYMLVMVWLFILVPSVMFIGIVPTWAQWVTGVLTATSLGLVTTTSFMDPGIVPMKAADPDGPKDDLVLRENGEITVLKWCRTCSMHRPPRASHCSMCGFCVEDFDHHCGIVGACVGKRNYRFFALFLWETTLLAAWCFAWTAVDIAEQWRNKKFGKNPSLGTIGRAMMLFYTFAIGTSLLSFGSYYCFLTWSDQTSKEILTGRPSNATTAPKHTLCEKFSVWQRKLFGPIPPSNIKPQPRLLS